MRGLFSVFLFLYFFQLYGQQNKVDSFIKLISSKQQDSINLLIYAEICDACDINDNLKYGLQGIDYIKKIKNKKNVKLSHNFLLKKEAYFTSIIRVYYEYKKDYKNIQTYDQKLLKFYRLLNDTSNLEKTYQNIATILFEKKEILKAFELIKQRLSIHEKNNSFFYVAMFQNQLAWMYYNINLYNKMAEYMQKSLTSNIKTNDIKSIAAAYSQLATAQQYNGEFKKALENNLKSLKYFEMENDDRKIFRALFETSRNYNSLNNVSKALEFSDRCMDIAQKLKDSSLVDYVYFGRFDIYKFQKNYEKAHYCVMRQYKYAVESKNDFNIMNTSLSLSYLYIETKKFKEALRFIKIAETIAKKTNDLYALKNAFVYKYIVLKEKAEYKKALEYHLAYLALDDSITKLENHKELEKQDLIYQFEIMELKKKEEQRLKDNKISEEKKTKNVILLSLVIFLLLVSTILVIVFRNFKSKQKSNIELAEKNGQITAQKCLVEEKQKEILDSISYAKRIQQAILPPLDFISTYLPQNFILYKPKDIVAGDFYWAEYIDNKFFIAAADSTGHGVPGAMVSVVCSSALNRSLKEFNNRETGKILDKARELVVETFEKSNEDVKDGMDISLLCIDKVNKKIFWSGANNPLWYIQNGQLIEIKADKQPIGKTINPNPFKIHEIEYKDGQCFYLFTDGFADQFGGPNGKKYKYKQFSELLLKNSNHDMKKQMDDLNISFKNWKGNLEQVDDVCVIGLRV